MAVESLFSVHVWCKHTVCESMRLFLLWEKATIHIKNIYSLLLCSLESQLQESVLRRAAPAFLWVWDKLSHGGRPAAYAVHKSNLALHCSVQQRSRSVQYTGLCFSVRGGKTFWLRVTQVWSEMMYNVWSEQRTIIVCPGLLILFFPFNSEVNYRQVKDIIKLVFPEVPLAPCQNNLWRIDRIDFKWRPTACPECLSAGICFHYASSYDSDKSFFLTGRDCGDSSSRFSCFISNVLQNLKVCRWT